MAAWTKLLLVALGVLVVAVGSWGLAQSIVATQDMIGEFWGLMDQTSTFVSGGEAWRRACGGVGGSRRAEDGSRCLGAGRRAGGPAAFVVGRLLAGCWRLSSPCVGQWRPRVQSSSRCASRLP